MRFLEQGKTVAILLGAQTWPKANLEGRMSFLNSAEGMKDYILSDQGLTVSEQNFLNLFDSDEVASKQIDIIGDFLIAKQLEAKSKGSNITDIFVYYVGHGSFVENSNEFLMLTKNSNPRHDTGCISARSLSRRLRADGPLMRQVVVLDCCFSGAAHRDWQAADTSEAAVRNIASDFPSIGTVLLCSAVENSVSFAFESEKYTMFTGALLEALRGGLSGFSGALSIRQARDLAWGKMAEKYGDVAVRPYVYGLDRGDGDLSDKPAFPNPAGFVPPIEAALNLHPAFQADAADKVKGPESASTLDQQPPADGNERGNSNNARRKRQIFLSVAGTLLLVATFGVMQVIARWEEQRPPNNMNTPSASASAQTGTNGAESHVASPGALQIQKKPWNVEPPEESFLKTSNGAKIAWVHELSKGALYLQVDTLSAPSLEEKISIAQELISQGFKRTAVFSVPGIEDTGEVLVGPQPSIADAKVDKVTLENLGHKTRILGVTYKQGDVMLEAQAVKYFEGGRKD